VRCNDCVIIDVVYQIFWQPLKDAICNPELQFEIISDILKPILDRHGYMPVLATV